jgi:CRISPR-associated protein Csm2
MAAQDQQLRRLFQEDATGEELVNYAREIGQRAADEDLGKTQIRNIYGTVKMLQGRGWVDGETPRALQLLIPKLGYAAARQQKLKALAATLTEAISYVKNQDMFKRFCDFFEAVVAFHYTAQEERKRGGRS